MPSPADAEPRTERASFAFRGLRSAGFGVAIGAALTLAFDYPWWSALTHSVCIAIACWFIIDTGRLAAARWVYRHEVAALPQAVHRWPGWPWMLVIVCVGSAMGSSGLTFGASDSLPFFFFSVFPPCSPAVSVL